MQQALLREDSFLFYTIHTVYYCFVIRVGVDIRGKEEDTKVNYKFKKEVLHPISSAYLHENVKHIRIIRLFLNFTSNKCVYMQNIALPSIQFSNGQSIFSKPFTVTNISSFNFLAL